MFNINNEEIQALVTYLLIKKCGGNVTINKNDIAEALLELANDNYVATSLGENSITVCVKSKEEN